MSTVDEHLLDQSMKNSYIKLVASENVQDKLFDLESNKLRPSRYSLKHGTYKNHISPRVSARKDYKCLSSRENKVQKI